MQPNDKILILGARGLVGSAIHRCLLSKGFNNLLIPTHQELDLKNESAFASYFRLNKPEYVFLAAA